MGNGIHSIINHNDMNPHARASCRIKNADSQRRRHLDPDYRTQEQSGDRGQCSVKRGDQARREEEQATDTSRRQTARLDKPQCRCQCHRWCRCLSVCKEFLCGKYDILSGVWLSVSCVCNE